MSMSVYRYVCVAVCLLELQRVPYIHTHTISLPPSLKFPRSHTNVFTLLLFDDYHWPLCIQLSTIVLLLLLMLLLLQCVTVECHSRGSQASPAEARASVSTSGPP